jgi:hypothetical protein
LHTSTFCARQIFDGWVIDATRSNGLVEQLIGVFSSKSAALMWISEHPAAWWKTNSG